jgi:serine/threonine protein kinase
MTTITFDGKQTWEVMGEQVELHSKYKVIDYLGSGAYGVVFAAEDQTTHTTVAIKKCKKIFQSKTLAKRTLREVRLLRQFHHENIVQIQTILVPHDKSLFNEIYIVFELMETDLAQIIRSPQKIKDQHIKYFTYQLLLGLRYLHQANIVHRDLKYSLIANPNICSDMCTV